MSSILNSLKLLADPTRLRILLLLSREALSVAELQEILAMGQSRISTQLAQLKKADLITDTRSGKSNIYQATLPEKLETLATEAALELPEHKSDLQSLKHILRKRKDTTRAYFDQLAGKFGKHYVPGRSWKSLAEALLKIHRYEVVADLGAGEGTAAQLFAQRAAQVIAIDNSPKMVEFGQDLAKKHQLPNLEFRLGEIEEIPIEDNSVDLALLSQALHHAQNPGKALTEAHRILKPGGTLVVLDLLQHSFEQARELYHDLHLGFSEIHLGELLESAGFSNPTTTIVDKEEQPPHFQTLLAVAEKGKG
ncbi:metalloregulator ArsR/SmtB family transcription factor [Roseibacillus persicicus]|uniref:metalloregulator ArsR/SmtB family transcription factor n=1 Tax=Roseibacillus persicicus TaxID=454148 RepID=UPI00280F1408|nr:metalloregulator ArsR/SmtB family transcription factor [Roseibacillus persicicus]MDQ8190750.1 metalloregulator ArsR/SmtB family transcription factor [Roseibacillus persicicus]